MSLQNIRVVLVNTSHPGNIGGAARAMKNMGLSRLVLVDPVEFPSSEAVARASGATDILDAVRVVGTLEEALVGCSVVLGTSARDRRIPWPLLDPRESGATCIRQAEQGGEVALVFGREYAGLTNEELQRCHFHVHIPSDPQFSSLNLAAAVQVLAYEVRMAWLAAHDQPSKQEKLETTSEGRPRRASQAETRLMFERMREDIQSVFHRDPAARNAFEVMTCYPGLHAIWFHRLSHWLWRRDCKWLARMNSNLGRWLTGIEIHPGAQIGRRFFIDHGMGIVIGETAEIGDDVTLYHGVTLGGTSWNKGKRHPTLEDGVIVGAGAKILGPFTVGAGAKVGSNAVVTRAVPAGATAVGIPGKIIVKSDDAQEAKRKAIAEKIGFDAYGVSEDMPDPVARAIGQLLDHVQAVEERMEGMCEALTALGSDYCAKKMPELREEDFAEIKEDGETPRA